MKKILIAGAAALTFAIGMPVMAQTADPGTDAAAAQAQIDALKVQLRLLEIQVDTLKGNVSPVAKEPTKAIVEVDNGSTTVGGQAFMDFGNISNQQNGVDITPTGTGFDIKRFYLIVDHKFDEVWAANLTTDAQYLADRTTTVVSSVGPPPKTTTVTTGSGTAGVSEVFIKKLYLQATLNDAFVVHAGSYTSPWAPFVEGLYGYRFIEKTQTDRLGYANTADWGLNATGKLGGGLFTYSASIVNGGGFKNPSRSKYVDYEARVGVSPVKWLTFGAGFYSGHLGQITTSNQDFPKNTASRWDVALGVHAGGFRIGGEYFEAKNYKSANPTTGVYNVSAVTSNSTTAPLSDKGDGYSLWSSFDFNDKWSVFGRYDEAKPSKDVVSELKDTFFLVGVDVKPRKGVDLALVYKNEKVENGQLSVSGADANGSYTIGGTGTTTNGLTTEGKFDEVGLYAQFTF
jgi:hypothetical protein